MTKNPYVTPSIPAIEPQLFCAACRKELIRSFAFKLKCIKAQDILDQSLTTTSITVNGEPQKVKEEVDLIEIKSEEICLADFLTDDQHEQHNEEPQIDPITDRVVTKNETLHDATPAWSPTSVQEELSTLETSFEAANDELDEEANLLPPPAPKKGQGKRGRKPGPRNEGQPLSTQRIMCDTCGAMMTHSRLEEHIRLKHSDLPEEKKLYQCDLCNAKLGYKPSLVFHMQTYHLEQRQNARECHLCTATFRCYQSLLTHRRKAHTDFYPLLKCPYCDLTTAYSTKYSLHIKRHLGEAVKKHGCTVCGRKFLQIRGLRDHMATHSEERKYNCEKCSATFKTHNGLKVHVRGVHTTPKAYECPVCQRTFATNQNLRFHVVKQHPEYELPPPGTVLKKNASRQKASSGFSLASNGRK